MGVLHGYECMLSTSILSIPFVFVCVHFTLFSFPSCLPSCPSSLCPFTHSSILPFFPNTNANWNSPMGPWESETEKRRNPNKDCLKAHQASSSGMKVFLNHREQREERTKKNRSDAWNRGRADRRTSSFFFVQAQTKHWRWSMEKGRGLSKGKSRGWSIQHSFENNANQMNKQLFLSNNCKAFRNHGPIQKLWIVGNQCLSHTMSPPIISPPFPFSPSFLFCHLIQPLPYRHKHHQQTNTKEPYFFGSSFCCLSKRQP